jgi:hypothetical protein
MVLYAYVLCLCILASSRIPWYDLGRQIPAFSGGFYHRWYQSQVRCKTHTKASKNHNNVIGEKRLAHIRTIVVSLAGKLTYVFFYAITELHQWRYVMIFGVLILFCYWWPYFIICGFSRTIRVCGCLLLLFKMIILLFVFSCRTLRWKFH